jgi:NDP-sugar pyrophosphorylase family protein
MRAVILAGGRGTRLAPYTTSLPKPLMPIGDMPIIEIVLRQLARYGFTDVTLAVGYLAELMMAYCGDGSRFGVTIGYSREETPLGTAGPIGLVDDLRDTFLVMNGDVLTTLDYGAMMRQHEDSGSIATLAVSRRRVQIELGIVECDGTTVLDYIEKPAHEYDASTGIYMFEPAVLEHLERGARADLPELMLRLMQRGHRVGAYRHSGPWLDIGRHDDYANAITVFEENRDAFVPSARPAR